MQQATKVSSEKENVQLYRHTLVVVGGLDYKPIKTEETGQQVDEDLQQGAAEDVAKPKNSKSYCRSRLYLTHLISCRQI